MDTQETPSREQHRGVSTEDLVDWAHRNQQQADTDAEREARPDRGETSQPMQSAAARETGTEDRPQQATPAGPGPDSEPTHRPPAEVTAASDDEFGGHSQPGQRPATEDLATAGADRSTGMEQQTAAVETADRREQPAQLFKGDQVQEFRTRWLQLQTAFVDEPRQAVQQADELVAEVMQTLAATFAEHKRELEGQWRREGRAETEELRLALRRYRSFFDQLLHS
jgi:hypothetical protein